MAQFFSQIPYECPPSIKSIYYILLLPSITFLRARHFFLILFLSFLSHTFFMGLCMSFKAFGYTYVGLILIGPALFLHPGCFCLAFYLTGMNITFQKWQINFMVDLTSHLSTSQCSKRSILMLLEDFLLLGVKQARRD